LELRVCGDIVYTPSKCDDYFFQIKFKLWSKRKLIMTNAEHGAEIDVELVISNSNKCEDLQIVEGTPDIYYIPEALKKHGGSRSDLNIYVTRFDIVLGYKISSWPHK